MVPTVVVATGVVPATGVTAAVGVAPAAGVAAGLVAVAVGVVLAAGGQVALVFATVPRVAMPVTPLAVTEPQPTTGVPACVGSVTVTNQLLGNACKPCRLLMTVLAPFWPLPSVFSGCEETVVPVQLPETTFTLIC